MFHRKSTKGRTMSLRLGARSAHCTQLATAELRQLVGRKGCELVLDCAGTEQTPG